MHIPCPRYKDDNIFEKAIEIKVGFKEVNIKQIPREEKMDIDTLANLGSAV